MRITCGLFLCLLLLVTVASLDAVSAATTKPPPSTRGKVLAVDAKAMTVTLEPSPGSAPVKCVFDDQSTVEINDQSATIKQIKTGLHIRSMRLDSSTPPVVEDLDLTSAGG